MSDLFPDDPVAVQARRQAAVRGLSVRPDDPPLFDLGESFNAIRRGAYLADEGISGFGSRLANIPNTALETPSYFHQSEAQHRLTDPTSYERTDFAAWLDEQANVNRREIRRITPDPNSISQAQQILSGVLQPITAGLVGAPLGPAGPALTLGAGFGAQSYDEQIEAGVDPETAERVAIGQAGLGAVMGVLPASAPIRGARFALWPALGRAASGAAINVGTGIVMRQSVHDTLMASENGDYSAQAERYLALDGQALMVDAILGAAFGTIFAHVDSAGTAPRPGEDGGPAPNGVDEPSAPILSAEEHLDAATEAYNDGDLVLARAHALMADRLGEQEGAFLAEQWAREGGEEASVDGDALGLIMAMERGLIKPTPEQIHAAMVMGDDINARVTTAPGIPLNVHADVVHAENLRAYDEAAANGEEFPPARWDDEDAESFAPHPDDVEAMARDIEFAVSSLEDVPTSLVDWVRRQGEVRDDRGRVVQRGGIRDDRGDIAGAASDGKRGFASLISPNGRTIDDLIVNAWEDGYFPDHADASTITAREFIDTVDRDAREGGSVTNDSNAAFNARNARDVIRHYEKNGIDVSLRGGELRRALSAITREAEAMDAIQQVLEQEGFSDLARDIESRRERIRSMGGAIDPGDMYFSRRGESAERRSEAFHDDRLSPQQNKAVEMALNNYSNAEIADELDVSLAQVSVVLTNARRRAPNVEIEHARLGTTPGTYGGRRTATIEEIVALHNRLARQGYSNKLGNPVAGRRNLNTVIGERLGLSPKNIAKRLSEYRAGLRDGRIEGEALFSRNENGEQLLTPEQFIDIAEQKLGATWDKLSAASGVLVARNVDELRSVFEANGYKRLAGRLTGAEKGVYLPSLRTTFLIAHNIRPDEIRGLMLHEIGWHSNIREFLGDKLYNEVSRGIGRMAQEGHPLVMEAMARAEAGSFGRTRDARRTNLIEERGAYVVELADLPENSLFGTMEDTAGIRQRLDQARANQGRVLSGNAEKAERALAWLMENAPELPLITRALARLRQWLIAKFGQSFSDTLTVEDIRQIAVISLEDAANRAVRESAEMVDVSPLIQDMAVNANPEALSLARSWIESFGGGPDAEARAIEVMQDQAQQATHPLRRQLLDEAIASVRSRQYVRGEPNTFSARVEEAWPEIYASRSGPDARPAQGGRRSPYQEELRAQGFDVESPLYRGMTRQAEGGDFTRNADLQGSEQFHGTSFSRSTSEANLYAMEGDGGAVYPAYMRGRLESGPDYMRAVQARARESGVTNQEAARQVQQEYAQRGVTGVEWPPDRYGKGGEVRIFDQSNTASPFGANAPRTAPDGGPVQAGRAPRRIFDVDGEFSTDPVVVIRNPTERDIMRLLRETKNSGVERPEQSLRFVTGSDGSIYVADANVAIHGSMRTQLARRGELIDPWQSDAPRPKGDGNIRFNRDGEIEVDQLDVPGRMNLREWLNPSRAGPNAGDARDFPKFSMGGRNARNIDTEALAQARLMNRRGDSADEIWRQTGWMVGDDGKWRFEIDTSQAELLVDLEPVSATELRPLSEVLDFPALFEAYPQLEDVPVDFARGRPDGVWKRKNDTRLVDGGPDFEHVPLIRVRSTSLGDARSTLLHEIQHAIQDIETFATGGSPRNFTQQREAIEARNALSWIKEMERVARANPEATPGELDVIVQNEYYEMGARDWIPEGMARFTAMDNYGKPTGELQELVRMYGLERQVTPLRDIEMYRRLSGEVEARNVERRAELSPEVKKKTHPNDTADVPVLDRLVAMAAPDAAFSVRQNADNLVGGRNARRDPIEAPEYQARVGRLQEALGRDDASGESGASRGQRSDAPVKDGDAPDKGLARQARDVLALSGVHIARIENPMLGSLRATVDSPIDLPARLRDALQEYPDARSYNAGIDFDVVEGGKNVADPKAPEGRRDGLYIRWTSVPDALQGAGIGSWLYRQVIDWAHRRGLSVFSDTSLTEKSWPMYERLKDYGYDVEQINPTTRDPITKTRESINDEPIWEIRQSYNEKPYDAAKPPYEDYQIDGPTLRERQKVLDDQRARQEEYDKASPLEQVLKDDPNMMLSMGPGRSVKASEAIEMSVEAQQEAVAKKKAFEAAVRCAIRHGGSMAGRSFVTLGGRGASQAASASQLLGQGLGLTAAGPAAWAVSHAARQNADPIGYAADRARMQAVNVRDVERRWARGGLKDGQAAGLDAPSNYTDPATGESVSDLANAEGEDAGEGTRPLAERTTSAERDPLQAYPEPSPGETPGAILRNGVQVARNDAGVAPVGPDVPNETPDAEEMRQLFEPIVESAAQGKNQHNKTAAGGNKDMPRGMIEEGNIDLTNRPVVRNADGTISTVRSMSFENDEGQEVLVPTVSEDGRILTDDEAIEQYYDTGMHLGIFSSARAATAYANRLHQEQERMYRDRQ